MPAVADLASSFVATRRGAAGESEDACNGQPAVAAMDVDEDFDVVSAKISRNGDGWSFVNHFRRKDAQASSSTNSGFEVVDVKNGRNASAPANLASTAASQPQLTDRELAKAFDERLRFKFKDHTPQQMVDKIEALLKMPATPPVGTRAGPTAGQGAAVTTSAADSGLSLSDRLALICRRNRAVLQDRQRRANEEAAAERHRREQQVARQQQAQAAAASGSSLPRTAPAPSSSSSSSSSSSPHTAPASSSPPLQPVPAASGSSVRVPRASALGPTAPRRTNGSRRVAPAVGDERDLVLDGVGASFGYFAAQGERRRPLSIAFISEREAGVGPKGRGLSSPVSVRWHEYP